MTSDARKIGVVSTDDERPVRIDHPLSLAYLGDAVWELYVRHHLLASGTVRPHDLQKQSIRFVSAKAQAAALKQLLPKLTEEERDVVRRGRNAKSKTSPKNTTVLDYRHSTAIEALVGFLYLTDQISRLTELMEWVIETVESEGNAVDDGMVSWKEPGDRSAESESSD